VSALERYLEGVLADERDILHAQLVWIKAFHPGQPARRAGFTTAFGAWTRPAKSLTRVAAAMPILPGDDHRLAFAVYIDVERKGIGVFQLLPYRTLMTGSCRKD
jgi:hypothetical protein